MKQRIITAVIGVTVLALTIWKIDTVVFVCAIAFVCALCPVEILNAVQNKNKVLTVISTFFAASVAFLFGYEKIAKINLLPIGCFLFVFVVSCLMLKDHKSIDFKIYVSSIFGAVILPLCFSSIIRLGNAGAFIGGKFTKGQGIYLTVFAFCCAWLTDAFAYFVGSKFGKHKMCPKISPKKSVEGAIGGFILSVVFNGAIYSLVDKFIISLSTIPFYVILILSGVLAVLSMIGDLTASVIKRNCSIKDFGNIFPGHGGMIDRFDSCIFVFPTLYFVMTYIN